MSKLFILFSQRPKVYLQKFGTIKHNAIMINLIKQRRYIIKNVKFIIYVWEYQKMHE